MGYDFVRIGNLLASRMALLLIVASARGCRWLVEQPSGSILESHPRFQHVLSIIKVSWYDWYLFSSFFTSRIQLTFQGWLSFILFHRLITYKVYTCTFWMGAFQGATPKRHRLWSNDSSLLQAIADVGGSMTREEMKNLSGASLVRKYIDSEGKKRHVGIPDRLKQSQSLCSSLHRWKQLGNMCIYI